MVTENMQPGDADVNPTQGRVCLECVRSSEKATEAQVGGGNGENGVDQAREAGGRGRAPFSALQPSSAWGLLSARWKPQKGPGQKQVISELQHQPLCGINEDQQVP